MMGDGMMWGMGIWWLVIAVLVLLAIAALVKYVFFR
jgi:tellurite resistance protein TehA-like permease